MLLALSTLATLTVASPQAQSQEPIIVTEWNTPGPGGYLGPEVVVAGTALAFPPVGRPDVTLVLSDVATGLFVQDASGTLGPAPADLAASTALAPPDSSITVTWRVPLTLAPGEYVGRVAGHRRGEVLAPWEDRDGPLVLFDVVDVTVPNLGLIANDATWSYYDNGDRPQPTIAAPAVEWYAPGFDATAWSSGPAELGYGDGDEATPTAAIDGLGQAVLAQYFRHEFDSGDLFSYDSITLSVLRDDGAIVYLNGVEVGRTNMPAGPVAYSTPALSVSEQTVEVTLDPQDFVSGTNVIAVEVHQSSATSSDISFALTLDAISLSQPKVSDNTAGTYLLAAGDMARCNFDGDEAVADQIDRLFDTDAGLFIGLGDLAYDNGTIADFNNCYAPTIGRYLDVTWPSPGNHEHNTAPNAAGYRQYFGANAGPLAGPDGGLWYSFDIDDYWHVIALDSDCARAEALPGAIDGDGCAVGSAQERWLRADLEANKDKNILAFFHHPPFTNNFYADHDFTQPLWRALAEYGAEITLHGHEHHYERYGQLDYWGDRDATFGMREFIIGSGGTFPRYDTRPQAPESDYRGTFPSGTNDFGVLQLWLRPDGYEWRWESIYGLAATDAGTSGLTAAMPRAGISGIVDDDLSGAPLVGIEVCATAARTSVATCATSLDDGSWQLAPLVSDTYELTTLDPAGMHQGDPLADVVLAAPNDTTGIALSMTPAASIAGSVTRASGDPIAVATICANRITDDAFNCANSNAAGGFEITDLLPGDYVVEYTSTGSLTECFRDNVGCGSPTLVTVAGIDVTGIDASLDPAPGAITGQVVAFGTNSSLPGISVCATEAPAAPVCQVTAADGSFALNGLLTGTYVVSYDDPTDVYVDQCYRDRSCDRPLLVLVDQPGVRTGINAAMQSSVGPTPTPTPSPSATPTPAPTATSTPTPNPTPPPNPTATPTSGPTPSPTATPAPTPTPTATGAPSPGSISGRITVLATGAPVFGARVCARRGLPAGEWCVISRLDGSYTVPSLATGNYSVSATDPVARYLPNCAGTRPCDEPTQFGVTLFAGRTGIDIALDPTFVAGSPTPTPTPPPAEGSISGAVTSNGAPAAAVEVCAVSLTTSVSRCGTSGGDGGYVIDGLATGNYRVEFDGAALCFRRKVACAGYTPVGVISPLPRTGIDGAL